MRSKKKSIFVILLQRLITIIGASGMTLLFFMVLPLMQAINKPLSADMTVQTVDVANVPPPPPVMEPEPEPEPEAEPEPPQLVPEVQTLDLSQLELALNPGMGGGVGAATDFTVNLNTVVGSGQELDTLFSMADLDQKPRVIYQPGPTLNKQVRQSAPGTVYIIFIVDKNGRVVNPKIQKSTAAVFEKPALNAVKKWKFEPGKRKGKPVRFRMRVPISFPKTQ